MYLYSNSITASVLLACLKAGNSVFLQGRLTIKKASVSKAFEAEIYDGVLFGGLSEFHTEFRLIV